MLPDFEFCENISRYAITSLLYEVSASPKPGLVDRYNKGAHRDMDIFTFMASSAALPFYFHKCALQGAAFQGNDLGELFEVLRPIGIKAEKDMFRATMGVNTHKGLIFSVGIICAAAAYCMKDKKIKTADAEEVCEKVSLMTRGLCSRELNMSIEKDELTNGERTYVKYGYKGIRGEVESGFPTVRRYSLPVLRQLKSSGQYSLNDILVQTLLHLMAVNDDTNIAARHDAETVEYVREYTRRMLNGGGMLSPQGVCKIYEMDQDFIERNISPGGSADLLAVTVMLDFLTETEW